jgi:hypothetical protein
MGVYKPKPEHVLQASVAAFFKMWLAPGVVWSSVDHGITFRGDKWQRINEWQRLKARGVKEGVPDIPLILWQGVLASIELKDAGKDADPEQLAFGAAIVAQGGHFAVCDSRRQVWEFMTAIPWPEPVLRPPPGALNLWLAKDGEPPKKRVTRATKPRAAKPTAAQVKAIGRMRARTIF